MRTFKSILEGRLNSNIYQGLESSRAFILKIGYQFFEMKSNFKRRNRNSYELTEGSRDYTNITLRAAVRRHAKS